MQRFTLTGFIAVAAVSLGGCLPDGAETLDDLEAIESEVVEYSEQFGGLGGRDFRTANRDPDNQIVSVQVRSGAEIDAIIVAYENGTVERWGGNGGTLQPAFRIPAGQSLEGFAVIWGNRIDRIAFFRSDGVVSPWYGGNGGINGAPLTVPPDRRLLGFRGRAQNRLDAIGLVWDRAESAVDAEGEAE